MPIYEYRCDSCGFQKEYIQRMSDALLTDCPECKKATFSKMVTAAGFQLKGGGWYVTDFKSGGSNTNATGAPKKTVEKQSDTTKQFESSADGKSRAEASASNNSAASTAAAASSTPAPSTAPASSGGT
jgi:putative FmdB family regulatory protein